MLTRICVFQARLQTAATERLQIDNDIKHWNAKADTEREKLAAAEEVAKTLEEEFEVCSLGAKLTRRALHLPPGVDS